jgi:hypothetical protein
MCPGELAIGAKAVADEELPAARRVSPSTADHEARIAEWPSLLCRRSSLKTEGLLWEVFPD